MLRLGAQPTLILNGQLLGKLTQLANDRMEILRFLLGLLSVVLLVFLFAFNTVSIDQSTSENVLSNSELDTKECSTPGLDEGLKSVECLPTKRSIALFVH
ncbi:MAG: hypothetical protein HRT61_06645 [Ekhidna sp.]|nr:hypothetical protein [Ekhidna sp.]